MPALDAWLDAARRDANRRGLPALAPLLDTLAEATRVLRTAAWNRHAVEPPAAGGTAAPDAGGPR